jgi:hypothetical protein
VTMKLAEHYFDYMMLVRDGVQSWPNNSP